MLEYSVVISTFARPAALREALESLERQERKCAAIYVVDASRGDETAEVCGNMARQLSLHHLKTQTPSAARQRNVGAALVSTPLVAFMDDDVILRPDTFRLLCGPFDMDVKEEIGGVAGRISDMEHGRPSGLLWWYYRLQAGYAHPHYGARLFGPAINCLPHYADTGTLIPAEWLNSTCVVYRTAAFAAEKFPEFEGYSFMEDVHLSARLAKKWRLFFHADAVYEHRSQPSEFKRDARALAASRIRHQRMVAEDVLGLRGVAFELKFLLHRLFATASILRQRPPQWREELKGTWT